MRRTPLTFDQWWTDYWKNDRETAEHDIARMIAMDAWYAAWRNR